MLNILAKILLAATSLAPVLGAVAINLFEHGKPWHTWIFPLIMALALMVLCFILLRYAENNAESCIISIESFERRDQEVLTFLFIYLLPFLRSQPSTFFNDWLTSLYILGIIVFAIAHAGAFHFNPAMRALGYRFYSALTKDKVSVLLISKKNLLRPPNELNTVRLAPNIYLHTGPADA